MVPAGWIVEPVATPSAAMFQRRQPALVAMLHLSLVAGAGELDVPALMQLLLDLAGRALPSHARLLIYPGPESAPGRQIARGLQPPAIGDNPLHAALRQSGRPLLVGPGAGGAMAGFLQAVGARHAVAAPLFAQGQVAGSLQMFRDGERGFEPLDAQILWLLTALAETHLVRRRELERLAAAAFTDFLTGLRSRGFFERMLEFELRRALRQRRGCALLLFDLDGFKAINDRSGHDAGDEVLRELARLLAAHTRDIDTAARFGGDEFALLLPDTPPAAARQVAARVGERVRAHLFPLPGGGAARLTVSVGIARCPEDARTPRDLLRAADRALYFDKRARAG